MSDHTTALVPIESWAYQSPELRDAGRQIDIGLFAESLIYYDRILLNVSNQPQLAELLRWAIDQNALCDFISLVKDRSISIYEYSFVSAPVLKDGRYIFLNIQDPEQEKLHSFEKRFLHHPAIKSLIPVQSDHQQLCRAFRESVIEVKADQFGAAIEEARLEYLDPSRAAMVVQAFLDEVYDYRGIGSAPDVEAQITRDLHGSTIVKFNQNFNQISSLIGKSLNFGGATPLQASVTSNRLAWSAAMQKCDLYLPSPMSTLVANKLQSADSKVHGTKRVIDELKAEVEFPDVRALVNKRIISFGELLKIRKKAVRFREWLQEESDRDRNAIIAYHHEVAKESGLLTLGRKTLSVLGVLGGGALGGALGTVATDAKFGAITGAIGSATGFLLDLGSRIGAEWKPVVFGRWMKERIEKHRCSV